MKDVIAYVSLILEFPAAKVLSYTGSRKYRVGGLIEVIINTCMVIKSIIETEDTQYLFMCYVRLTNTRPIVSIQYKASHAVAFI